jgi:hypothetical protein
LAPFTAIVFRRLQLKNALAPMLLTLEGMIMLVNPSHNSNAYDPILWTLDGIIKLVSELHPKNAISPM